MTAWAELGLSVPRSGGANAGVCEFVRCRGLLSCDSGAVQGTPWSSAEASPAPFYPDSEDVNPVPAASIYQGKVLFLCQILGIVTLNLTVIKWGIPG